MTLAELRSALQCSRPGCACQRSANVHCPVAANHRRSDQVPSLTLHQKDGKILLHCHTGCAQDAVIAALEQRGLWGANGASPAAAATPGLRLVKAWTYVDAGGTLLAEHGRFEGDGGKQFKWRLPGDGDWKGLGGLTMAELPLYNLPQLLARPDEKVWLVEGEKAADACTGLGLLAVSLPGGAAQRQFGRSLAPLEAREVVLWPDNDQAGQALMQAVAAVLPRARFVKPQVPEKGDAVDYFGQGGTVEQLQEMASTEPRVGVQDDVVMVDLPWKDGWVQFDFQNLTFAHKADAHLTVRCLIPGIIKDDFSGDINLASLSSRDTYRKQLDLVYGKSDFEWAKMLNQACQLAKEAALNAHRAINLADIRPDFTRVWAVEGLIPYGPSLWFGDGSATKTYHLIELGACAISGRTYRGRSTLCGPVCFLDYEANEITFRNRLHRLGIEPPEGFHYLHAGGVPVPHLIELLIRELKRTNAQYLFIDSAADACGGEPEKPQPALDMFNALSRIKIPIVMIAHITKDSDRHDTEKPFGSAFWHNRARMTWFIHKQQEENADDAYVEFVNRKPYQDDAPQPRFGLRVKFGTPRGQGPVVIESCDLRNVPEFEEHLSLGDRLQVLLRGHAEHYTELAKATGKSETHVKKELSRLKARGLALDLGAGVWGLKTARAG